jgi:hypothetical protein
VRQGHPEAYRVHGCFESFHITARREGSVFFKLLKAKEKFEWSKEADAAFVELKQFLTSPLVLTAPKDGETLLMYIMATNRVVSTASVIEREEVGHVYMVQRPVYFISKVLNESKARYP